MNTKQQNKRSRRDLIGSLVSASPQTPDTGRPAGPSNKTLVVVFLRGAADGLSLVAPTMDSHYQNVRGALAIPPPTMTNGVKDLDGFFALGPGAAALHPIYQAGRLAFVHRTGLSDTPRSHFDSMYYLETVNDPLNIDPTQTDGWVGRHIDRTSAQSVLLRGMSLGSTLPRTLIGAPKAIPIKDPEDFTLPPTKSIVTLGGNTFNLRDLGLTASHAHATTPTLVAEAGTATLNTIELMSNVTFDQTTKANYAAHPFGAQLWGAAQLIDAQVGIPELNLESIVIDFGGWDDHELMSPLAPDAHCVKLFCRQQFLAQSLAAFEAELLAKGRGSDYTLVVMSEFGRRVEANGQAGTEHGYGNAWIVMGEGVQGGQVFADGWQFIDSLDMTSVMVNGDLDISIDCRDLLAEMLVNEFGLPVAEIPTVFPGYGVTGNPYNPRGIVL